MKLLIDAGATKERKELLKEALKGKNLDFHFIDESTDEQISECEVLLQSFTPPERIAGNVSRAGRLRMLQTVSAGVDKIPFGSIPESVMVCSNAGAFSEPIAEHTFALILALAKRLKENEMKLRSGVFDQQTTTMELSGKMLGILGYGGIGRAVASLGRCMGMSIYGISRSREHEKECDAFGGMDKLDDMLSRSDVVVIAIPLNRETMGLIGREKLSLMKDRSILVNVARGDVIVEKDLYDHLAKHPGFCAGIEVWWKEPRHGESFSGNMDFLSLPNVIGSPHNSGIVDDITVRVLRCAIDNIALFASGGQPKNIVRREDYVEAKL